MEVSISRERIANAAAIAGVTLLIGAGLRYLFQAQFDRWAQVAAILGGLALVGSALLLPDRIRRGLTGRRGRYGSNAVLMSVAFAGILVVINILVFNNPQRVDLTEDRQFSLSEETQLLLSELSTPVEILGFYTPDMASSRESIRPLLDQYELKSDGSVTYRFIDPRSDPLSADRYGITRDGSMAVVLGESSQVIDFPSEREISSAIIRLTNPESRKIYFLTGHGERELEAAGETGLSQLKAALESKNYEIGTLNLLIEADVPADAWVLLIAGSLQALSEAEIDVLRGFMSAGGALVVLHEPSIVSGIEAQDDSLAAYLETDWGIRLEDDLVVDLGSTMPLAGIANRYASHPITQRMENLASYFPTARSIGLNQGELPEGISPTELVYTGDNSWGETDLEGMAQASAIDFDGTSDHPGPLVLAALAESASGARLVVVGDSDFAANSDFRGLGNGDLIVNSIDWAARQEQLINITPRAITQRQVIPPSRESVLLLVLATVVLLPGSVVVMGLLVWWNRRKRV